jgi:predicted nuclease with TOPRIM domain
MRDQCIERLKEQLKKTITDISSLESKYSKLKVVSRGLQEKLSQVADELEVGKTENTSLKQCKK